MTRPERQSRMRPPATPGQFARDVGGNIRLAAHLQLLDDELAAMFRGEFRRLVVAMPPRHGKSEMCSKYLPAWFLGRYPDRRVILSSYESDFAESWGRKARGLLAEDGWRFNLALARGSAAARRWDLSRRKGGMIAVGVGGAITGKGADLLIVDDPVKNAQQATTPAAHERTWDWWESTALTRLEPGACVVVMQTRWHEDDLAGRIQASSQRDGQVWRVIRFPALAEPTDPLGRFEAGALWPERWPQAALEEVRTTRRGRWWNALYQQSPTPPGGEMFRKGAFQEADKIPDGVVRAVRFWDKASTEGSGDYTVGVLMLAHPGGFLVADVVRGQWRANIRDERIAETCKKDQAAYGSRLEIWFEQEPGSSGKDAVQYAIRSLPGMRVRAERPTGSKTTRADPFAAQVEAGNVQVLQQGDWKAAYLDELTQFPYGVHDDQVDASAGAFLKLAEERPAFQVWVK